MEKDVKILIVDDRPENLKAIGEALHSPIYEIVMASSGGEALKYVLRETFAVILLNAQMPGLNSYDTARMIRLETKSKATPIVFITDDHPDAEEVKMGYELGAIDYIFKPVDPGTLRFKISGFVNIYRHKEQLEILIAQRTHELFLLNKELDKSNAHFKAIFNKARIGIVTASKDGVIIKANPYFQNMLGYSEKELTMIVWPEITYPEDLSKDWDLFQKVITGEINYYDLEKRYICKDGTLIWAYLCVVSSKDILIGFVQDISEKKRSRMRFCVWKG